MSMENNADRFWEMSESISPEEAKMNGYMGIGLDIIKRCVVVGLEGRLTDISIREARALARGLELAADALQLMIAETN